ncbi:MAG TPA: PAS domain S-box protein [Paludibacter sp.]|nr:PAS domain S-box protein [Paludibacter sp.]
MKDSIVIEMIRNIAVLLTFSIVYDHFWASSTKVKNTVYKLLSGVFLGSTVIIIILTPWNYESGIFFDTRSVMISISGLFFGPIPTITAMFIASAYRLYLGGAGVFMGIAVILTSGTIGILWSFYRPGWQKKNSSIELMSLGILVHIVMLACTLLLPSELRMPTFRQIFFSVIILYPLATVLLGEYIIKQNQARNTKKELEISEKRWQFALEGAGDGIWDWNPMTNEIYFSKQWKSILGFEKDEITNSFVELEKRVHPEDFAKTHELIIKHINGESQVYSSEHRLMCKNGTYKWILDSGKIMQRDANGNPLRFICTQKDISDRKEKELLLENERFLVNSLMNFTPESIYFKDLNSKFIRVNEASAKSMGCNDLSQIIGKSDFDFYDNEYATKTFKDEQNIIQTGTPYHAEEVGHTIDGRETWGITNKMPLRDPTGEIIGTFGLTINITERKLAEQALLESEQYTNSILSAIPDLIFILNSECVFLDCKTGNVKDLAVPKEEFINKNISEVFPDPLASLFRNKIEEVLNNQAPVSIEYQIPVNGELGDFECFIIPFVQNKVIAMVRNITSRKQIENKLKTSQKQLKSFAAHLQHVREEERVSLAREIHDELGQILIALKIDLGIFKQQIFKALKKDEVDDIRLKFDQIYSLVDKTIKTTRKIMTGLRPEVLEMVGFQEAARLSAVEFGARYKINCNFSSPASEIGIGSQQSIALFRILQEALNNIIKHARATEVDVLVDIVDNKYILKISDNGIGLDENKQVRNDSYGLIGMRERAYLLDGKLTISGTPGKGTTVLVEMPCQI